MIELLPMLQTSLSGINLAVLLLVLYRVNQLEVDVRAFRDKLNETSEKVIRLETVEELG